MSKTLSKPFHSNLDVPERGVLKYGDDIIQYEVIRRNEDDAVSSKKVSSRKVIIKVHANQRVVATVPHDATDKVIHAAMLKRVRWIWNNIIEFAEHHNHVIPKQFVSGEVQFYLGRRYMLKVTADLESVSTTKLSRGKLTVNVINNDNEREKHIKALLYQWYSRRAKFVFYERLQALLPRATWVRGIPSFRLMTMKKQWGSCSNKGSLILNPHLVKAPKVCIDYVILHELCHIAEHNHSEKFWRLLTQVMPNWQEIKDELDGMAELYLNE